MSTREKANQIIDLLGLAPHPTCGFVAETYRSSRRIPSAVLPPEYEGDRPLASVLYFMVTTQTPIRLHRIRSDQMYHHYLGAPLEVLLLYPEGTGEVRIVGPDLAMGMRPQLLIPGGTYHISRIRAADSFALLGTTEWPGFENPDVELGDPQTLMMEYPAFRRLIEEFIGSPAGG
ncbi:hypothetical protein W02_09790 [Nitrospira sp. KM1]|uniref:cupin domain-containing protein n=1 Tax=Nitrospira sp. KM1 TaxID=1936990 RepID=UPI0013A761D9|nr:cupin domain-containing protein [Nitrospira sp. KM1]BCA53839.1 hypothetical protein W02_09790 [Nitrospira sp. KM1]